MREGWKRMKIADICEKASSNIALNKIQNIDGDYPIYGASGYIKNVNFYHRDRAYIGIVKDGSGVGRVNTYPPMTSLLGTMQYILPKDGYCLGYVAYALKSLNLASFASGAAIPHIYFRDYGQCEICVPSFQEQERIVAELDLLTGIIDKQKQQLKELDTLAQSIFYDMFGNPVENDKGWEKKQIGKICTSKKQIQRASKRFKDSDIIRYIDISSIDNINNVMTSTTSYGFGDAPSRAQQVVEIGDVLISLVRPNLNNVAMVSEDGTDLVASSGFCVLRANCEIVKEFLFYSVKMKCFTDYLMQRVSGANYPAVREDDIMGYNIILPPLELQESFAQKIQSIESQKQSINRSLAESQKLFDYTMDKYFG